MTPHATEDTNAHQTNGNMSNDSAPLTNGETPRSKSLSVSNTPSTHHIPHSTVSVTRNGSHPKAIVTRI
jgi:hypothetical protein